MVVDEWYLGLVRRLATRAQLKTLIILDEHFNAYIGIKNGDTYNVRRCSLEDKGGWENGKTYKVKRRSSEEDEGKRFFEFMRNSIYEWRILIT
jgi:hypothetical protein